MNKDRKKANLNVITVLKRAVFLRSRDERKIEDQPHVSEVFLENYYGRKTCALACFMYNDFGLRSEPPLGSTGVREYSRFFIRQTADRIRWLETLFLTFVVVYARGCV